MQRGTCIFKQALERVEQRLAKLPESEQYQKKREDLLRNQKFLQDLLQNKAKDEIKSKNPGP